MIKVSVVIPVYNDPTGLQDALESLVTQSFSKNQYEIIVADNGSTDKTLDVAKKYSKKNPQLVRYVIEDNIQSSYAARNKGIDVAMGSILAFTDADCIPAIDWLKNGYSSMKESSVSMAAGRIEFTYKNLEPNIWEYFDSGVKLNQKAYVENAGFGATANLFVRKTVFDKHGLFLLELKSGGDYEFGRRVTQSGGVLIYAEKALVLHPARSTFRDKLVKSKRIAQGQKILAEMGLLYHGQINWRQLILTKHYPSLPGVKLGIIKKILLVLINNFFKYYNYFNRI